MSEAGTKIIFTPEVKEAGYAKAAEKASSAVLIPSVSKGKECVAIAANDAQKRAESVFTLT